MDTKENDSAFKTVDKRGQDDSSPQDETQEAKKDFNIKKENADKEHSREEDISFTTFIISLSSSAFLHFGEMPNPQTGKKEINLPAAKQTIDMLAMLEKKTKGNLTKEEDTLIERVLYDLRMKYLEYINRGQKG